MSAPDTTPKKLTNKEKHNRESIMKTIEKDYETITKGDLEEPTEVIERDELNEPSVLVERAGIPNETELETVGKPYGTTGSVGLPLEKSKLADAKAEKDKMGKVVDDDYVKHPDVEKIVENKGK